MKSFRWFITNTILLALALAWLVPFYCILKYGTHTVAEPSLPILIGEIALFVGIIILAVWNMGKAFKRLD